MGRGGSFLCAFRLPDHRDSAEGALESDLEVDLLFVLLRPPNPAHFPDLLCFPSLHVNCELYLAGFRDRTARVAEGASLVFSLSSELAALLDLLGRHDLPLGFLLESRGRGAVLPRLAYLDPPDPDIRDAGDLCCRLCARNAASVVRHSSPQRDDHRLFAVSSFTAGRIVFRRSVCFLPRALGAPCAVAMGNDQLSDGRPVIAADCRFSHP